MTLKLYLIVTGIGSFVALAIPSVVVVASFLIIPGLILMIMPTAFLYGMVFAGLRLAIGGFASGILLNLLAAAGTVAFMWAIPQPGLALARAKYAALKQPTVAPVQPVPLRGAVLIKMLTWSDLRCNDLCVALLKTPGVISVQIESESQKGRVSGTVRTYRILPSSAPGNPARATQFGLLPKQEYNAADPLADRRGLEAEWNLLLASGKTLIETEDRPEPDFVITVEDGWVVEPNEKPRRGEWTLFPKTPRRNAVMIATRNGDVLVRKSILSVHTPSAPLLIGAEGGMENFRFGWARQRVGDGRKFETVDVNDLLMAHTNIARGVDREAAERNARVELVAALDSPARSSSDPAFLLANQWMESFQAKDGSLSASDRALVLRIVQDRRIVKADGIGAVAEKMSKDTDKLRSFAAHRYSQTFDRAREDYAHLSIPHERDAKTMAAIKEARYWVNALGWLPAGAFASQNDSEVAILADPERSRHVTTLIARQGDRGAAAIPDLLRLLREHSTVDPGKYGFGDASEAIDAVRRGFRMIGPAAAPASADIEALLATPGMQRRYKTKREEWDVLLHILGRPLDSFSRPENR